MTDPTFAAGGIVQPGGHLAMVTTRDGVRTHLDEHGHAVSATVFGGPLDGLEVAAWPYATDVRFDRLLRMGLPDDTLPDAVNAWRWANKHNLFRGARRVALARAAKLPHFYGALWGRVIRGNGQVEELGLMSLRVVTTAGVTKVVDFLRANDTTTGQNFKFHGYGTGATAEASADTALVTELTTEYNPNSTRPTGTQTNNGATVYRTVGTLTPDSGTPAVTEHGLFSQAATGGGTLFDRSLFSAVNLNSANGDSLQTTYDGTFAAGG